MALDPRRVVRVGVVGVGSRGTFLLRLLLQTPGAAIRAVGDVDASHAQEARAICEQAGGDAPEAYTRGERDFERLCARDDLDAVVIATPWEWHTPVAIAAMRAGKYAGVEVPAALTMPELQDLVRTSEQTGVPCMMLENVNYYENVLSALRMVREGVYGDVLHAEAGYQHDVRFLLFTEDGRLTWRTRHYERLNGNLYPTHAIGPVAWWLNINRGDRFTRLTSVSTPAACIQEYAARRFGGDHELARRHYALGDINTTLIQTARGRTVTLYHTITTPRPYDLIFRLQGTRGIYEGGNARTYIEGVSPASDQWEPFDPYLQRYPHPLWQSYGVDARKSGGHGGGDYIMVRQFIDAVRAKAAPPQDVYDAATWSAIVPLSIASVARGGASVTFPDFTHGRWKTAPPIPVTG